MNKSLQLAIMGAVIATHADNSYRYGKYHPHHMPDGGNGFSKEPPKAVDSRQLREFSIKGRKVMAYSRKDAITRLKHMKKK